MNIEEAKKEIEKMADIMAKGFRNVTAAYLDIGAKLINDNFPNQDNQYTNYAEGLDMLAKNLRK